jgi:hypothetical protein
MRFNVKVELLCKDSKDKAFSYEYTEVVEGTPDDVCGQYSHLLSGAIEKAIIRVEQEYQNCNVEVIHCYKVKDW